MIKEASKIEALKAAVRRYRGNLTGRRVKGAKKFNAQNKEVVDGNYQRARKQAKDSSGTPQGYVTKLDQGMAGNMQAINKLESARVLSMVKSDRNRARLLTAGGVAALGLGVRAAMKGSKKPISKGLMKSLKKHKGKVIAGGAGVTGLSLLAGNK